MTAIIKKELRTYFSSWIGYIYLLILVGLTGVYFSLANVLALSPSYHNVLSGTSFIFLIITPLLTMRLFAEEARQKTDQLLFTAPLSVTEIVVGKFIAAFVLFMTAMVITMLFPLMLSRYGILPTNQIAGAFIGYILLVACFIALGMFMSLLTDNQIIAAVSTFAVLFLLFIMDSIANSMPVDTTSSLVFVGLLIIALSALVYDSTKNIFAGLIVAVLGLGASVITYVVNNLIFDGIIVKVLQWLSLMTRFNNFMSGILNLSDICYYLTFIIAFLFLSVNLIEKRRWR